MTTRKPSKKAKSRVPLPDIWFFDALFGAEDAVASLVEELQEINKRQVGRKK